MTDQVFTVEDTVDTLMARLPPHTCYVELFAGGAALYFARPAAQVESPAGAGAAKTVDAARSAAHSAGATRARRTETMTTSG